MKLSIITPVYKGSKSLEKFIENIKKQTSNDYEVIFVVDTNNDNVLSVVEELVSGNNNFKIIYNTKRTSRYEAISLASTKAIGEFSMIASLQNQFNENMVRDALEIAKNKNADIIETKATFIYPIKFSGKIRKPFNKITEIEKHPEVIAFTYPFDFNKIYRTSVLVESSKFKLPVRLNSRYSIDMVYLPLLVAKTYATSNNVLVISKSKLSDNFNPLKMIRQWEALHKLSKTYHSIQLSPVFTYAQYYSETVFMSSFIKEFKNKVLEKKFNDKFKKQQSTLFQEILETNKFMQENTEEKSAFYKYSSPTTITKLIKELY